MSTTSTTTAPLRINPTTGESWSPTLPAPQVAADLQRKARISLGHAYRTLQRAERRAERTGESVSAAAAEIWRAYADDAGYHAALSGLGALTLSDAMPDAAARPELWGPLVRRYQSTCTLMATPPWLLCD